MYTDKSINLDAGLNRQLLKKVICFIVLRRDKISITKFNYKLHESEVCPVKNTGGSGERQP